MERIYRIPSGLYYELFSKGGDRLVSVFSILKTSKGSDIKYYAFTSKNGKKVSHYNLIRHYTGLTLHSIKKYVDILIEMGLCYFDENGDFILLGNQKLKRQFRGAKLVPILIGKNIVDTSYSVFAVRLHSNQRKQQNSIDKKTNRRVIINKNEDDLNYSELKLKKIFEKKEEKGFFVDKCVLSIKGFAVLKDSSKENKSKGLYWKKKLSSRKLIETTRRFVRIKKSTHSEYLLSKDYLPNKTTFKNGFLVNEIESEINVKSILKQS